MYELVDSAANPCSNFEPSSTIPNNPILSESTSSQLLLHNSNNNYYFGHDQNLSGSHSFETELHFPNVEMGFATFEPTPDLLTLLHLNNSPLHSRTAVMPFGRGRGGNRGMTKQKSSERQRRFQTNNKYEELRNLLPNPTKTDRASVVGDAIGYIEELKRTVEELKLIVQKKRCQRGVESCHMKPDHEQSYNNGSLRSSWVERKSKDTEVDVQIIHDEVTVKVLQRKKINPVLSVSKILDELELDLHHVAGGHIGNTYSFLFNAKMYEGSSLYASAIANKLIEALDRQDASIPAKEECDGED